MADFDSQISRAVYGEPGSHSTYEEHKAGLRRLKMIFGVDVALAGNAAEDGG